MSLVMSTQFRFNILSSVTDEGGMGDLLGSDGNGINTIPFSWFYSLTHVSLLVWSVQLIRYQRPWYGRWVYDSIGLIVSASSCIISIRISIIDSFRDLIWFDLIRFPFRCSPWSGNGFRHQVRFDWVLMILIPIFDLYWLIVFISIQCLLFRIDALIWYGSWVLPSGGDVRWPSWI